MSVINLLNDKVTSIPIVFMNAVGQSEPPMSGDSYSATSSSASLGVAVGSLPPMLVLTPKVQAGAGYTVTVSDADGLPALTQIFDIVADTVVTTMALNPAGATTLPQSLPTAPGP
jgi:hypothetical protein